MSLELPRISSSALSLQDLPVGKTSLGNAVVVGLKEIWAHKFRSALTMLGIVLGVSICGSTAWLRLSAGAPSRRD